MSIGENNTAAVILLSVFAATTILLSLPVARLQRPALQPKSFLTGAAAGILLYLLVDLLGHARERPEEVMSSAVRGEEPWGHALVLTTSFVAGLGLGVLLLAYLQRRWDRSPMHQAATATRTQPVVERASRLGLLIAVGIGLYNFAQGMGMGQAGRFTVPTAVSSGAGQALLLSGLAVQTLVKGVSITGPLAGFASPMSWRYLLSLAVLAGSPIVLGTLVGVSVWIPDLFVGVLTLAAGALVVAVRALLHVGRVGGWKHTLGGLLAGFLVALVATFFLEISHYSLPELKSSFWL